MREKWSGEVSRDRGSSTFEENNHREVLMDSLWSIHGG